MNISTVKLYTNLLEELLGFYDGKLGLEVIERKSNSFSVRAGSTRLIFERTTNNDKPYYHIAFNIPENQIEDAKKWTQSGISLMEYEGSSIIDFSSWKAHSIYFYDPAGNIIELIARHRLKNSSNEEFGAESFLNVSEVGMPVNDVRVFYEDLSNVMDIPIFSGNLDGFTAIGDDTGLFILVPVDRKWFPDCPVSMLFPMSIVVEGVEGKEVFFEDFGYRISSKAK